MMVLSSNLYTNSSRFNEDNVHLCIPNKKRSILFTKTYAFIDDCLGDGRGSYRDFVLKDRRLSTILATLPTHLVRLGKL